MRWPSFARHHPLIGLVLVAAVGAAGWLLLPASDAPSEFTHLVMDEPEPPKPAGPPWLYGRSDARFTVIGYADLECPYCRAYFQVLKRWIDAHPEVNWQWHHLSLAMHEPAATAGARVAECAGEIGGHAAFWQAVAWLYGHTRGDGQGLPAQLRYPDLTPAMQQCLDSERADAVIHAQATEAAQSGIAATPALQLRDRESGRTLLLHGPVEGDALLSAVDLLAAGSTTASESLDSPDMPASVAGDMPR
ncbi:MAG: DsbA family protein [Panacagrimonas sp.]